MNDSSGSGSGNPGDPYGKRPAGAPDGPPPPPNPYGQKTTGQQPPPYPQPYGQSPAQSPYGQQPFGQAHAQGAGEPASPYGQPPYGHAATGNAPGKRPTTVTAAAVITMVASGLTGLLVLLSLAFLGTMRDDVMRQIEQTPGFEDTGISADSLFGVVAAMLVVVAVWCLIACILAIFVLRGSNGARITLVVSASMAALFSLVAIASGASVVTLVAAIAAIVLLFTGGAGDWFRSRGASQAQQGYPQPPSW